MSTETPTVLVVEDDGNDVLLLERAVERAGLQAGLRVVRDGKEAVAYLERAGRREEPGDFPLPILLLLDLRLPGLSGFEVLSWLRGRPGLRRLPVVVLSSSREGRDVNRAYELGANSYLVKPTGFDELVELVALVGRYWIRLNERPVLDGR